MSIELIGAIIFGVIIIASFFYKPVVCFICGEPMIQIGKGRGYCINCNREGVW